MNILFLLHFNKIQYITIFKKLNIFVLHIKKNCLIITAPFHKLQKFLIKIKLKFN